VTALRGPHQQHEPLPARVGIAARVLSLLDDPNTDVGQLVTAVAADPTFAARVIGLANSSYYGLSGRVSTLNYAICVLGFQTLRALAVSLAAGVGGRDSVPEGFWETAATSATAASHIAPLFGAQSQDAFSVGLLHTIGSAVLHREQPVTRLCLPMPTNVDDQCEREREVYGVDHAVAGAQLLTELKFPRHVCALVANHHHAPLQDASPIARTLYAARTIADLALNPEPDRSRAEHTLRRLSEGSIGYQEMKQIALQVKEQAVHLADGLHAVS